MTPWAWWAGIPGENEYTIASEEPTREAVILAACRNLSPGDQFEIVEARCSSAAKYYDGSHEVIPFVRTRSREVLTVGPAEQPA